MHDMSSGINTVNCRVRVIVSCIPRAAGEPRRFPVGRTMIKARLSAAQGLCAQHAHCAVAHRVLVHSCPKQVASVCTCIVSHDTSACAAPLSEQQRRAFGERSHLLMSDTSCTICEDAAETSCANRVQAGCWLHDCPTQIAVL